MLPKKDLTQEETGLQQTIRDRLAPLLAKGWFSHLRGPQAVEKFSRSLQNHANISQKMRPTVGSSHPLSFTMNSATKGRFVGLIGLASIALWLTLNVGSAFALSLQSLRWPTMPVRVISSGVSTGVSNVGRWWEPELIYEYQVGGRSYDSSSIRYLMPPFYRAEAAHQIAAAYPVGVAARAAYDPANPAKSVLEPGIPAGMWWRLLMPLFFWVLAGYILYEIRNPDRRLLLLPDVEPAE